MSRRVLIVDDEKGIREALKQVLEFEELEVQTGASGHEALRLYAEFRPHLVFLDVKMQGMDGIETLARLRQLDPQAQVVMISGHGTIQTAVEATQLGAYDFLPTPARVLITGANGTGKELVARAIHALSPRARGPFVEVNCAAIPTELIESELFGHVKGSFTGAFADRAGKFELADGGTLFLDEIGDMSLSAQAKVLRVLQEGVIARVGSGKLLPVDVRVIAATNKDLEREIAEGRFREDLLYRINVVPIEVPPLRERRADIPQLVQHFVDDLTKRTGLPAKAFDAGALKRLSAYDWPGNIRELRNAVERLLILGSGPSVTELDVEQLVASGPGDRGRSADGGSGGGSVAGESWLRANTFEEFKQAAERAYLLGKLKEHDWNVSETARTLEMPRSNLYKKIERYGLAREA